MRVDVGRDRDVWRPSDASNTSRPGNFRDLSSMEPLMRYLMAVLLVCVSSATRAADPVSEVESAIERLNDAFQQRDVVKARSLMTPNHVAITPFAGKQQLEEQLRTLPDLKYDQYSAGPMSATTISDTCVLLTYPLQVKGSYQGKALPARCLVSAVWVNNDGQWQELKYQETVVPEETATDRQLRDELTALERQSWEATMKDDTRFFETFLADEATGMLADGSIINREQIIKNLDEMHLKKYTMGKSTLLRVSEESALILYPASYEALHKGVEERFAAVNCSALYVRRGGKWRQLFYQETSAEKAPAAANR